jgi:hypothetical protein
MTCISGDQEAVLRELRGEGKLYLGNGPLLFMGKFIENGSLPREGTPNFTVSYP